MLFVNNRSTISLSYDGSVDLISFVRDTQYVDMNFEGMYITPCLFVCLFVSRVGLWYDIVFQRHMMW